MQVLALVADAVAEHDEALVHAGVEDRDVAPVVAGVVQVGAAALRRVRRDEQHARAVLDGEEREVRLPGVVADQRRDAPVAGVEGAHRLADGEVLALLEDVVRRQVELAVRVDPRAGVVVRRRVVVVDAEPVLAVADADVGPGRDRAERRQPRVVVRDRDVLVDLRERVARQEQLREDDEVAALAPRVGDDPGRALEVRIDVAERARELGEGDPHRRFGGPARMAREGSRRERWAVTTR